LYLSLVAVCDRSSSFLYIDKFALSVAMEIAFYVGRIAE